MVFPDLHELLVTICIGSVGLKSVWRVVKFIMFMLSESPESFELSRYPCGMYPRTTNDFSIGSQLTAKSKKSSGGSMPKCD